MAINRNQIPTVRVQAKTKSGYVIINQADYDPKIHQLYEEKPEAEPEVPKKISRKKKEDSLEEMDLSDPDLI